MKALTTPAMVMPIPSGKRSFLKYQTSSWNAVELPFRYFPKLRLVGGALAETLEMKLSKRGRRSWRAKARKQPPRLHWSPPKNHVRSSGGEWAGAVRSQIAVSKWASLVGARRSISLSKASKSGERRCAPPCTSTTLSTLHQKENPWTKQRFPSIQQRVSGPVRPAWGDFLSLAYGAPSRTSSSSSRFSTPSASSVAVSPVPQKTSTPFREMTRHQADGMRWRQSRTCFAISRTAQRHGAPRLQGIISDERLCRP